MHVDILSSYLARLLFARAKVVKKRKEDDEFGRLLLRLVPARVHLRTETRIRNYVTASPYQIRRNSGDGTTPNKVEIRSLRQINLWSLSGVLQGRLRGVSGWARMCPVCPGQVSDFQPSIPSPSPGAYLTNFGFR